MSYFLAQHPILDTTLIVITTGVLIYLALNQSTNHKDIR